MLDSTNQVLVTGASGFIGTRLCQALRERGCQVRTTSRNDSSLGGMALDLAELDSFPQALCAGIDTVFHLAGKAHALAELHQDNSDYWRINTDATRKLLEAARLAGVKRFVYFSSVKAVAASDTQPIDETFGQPATDPYGLSKYQAEQLVLTGGYVPHSIVLRPSMVYGGSDKGNLPRMAGAIRRGLFPPLPECGNRRSMVYVDDLVAAALLAAEKPEAAGQIYIVTDRQAYSTRQIYDEIRLALGKPAIGWSIPMPLLKVVARFGDLFAKFVGRRFPLDSDTLEKLTGSAWYSSAKIGRDLGFQPKHSLREVLPNIIHNLD